MANKKKAMLHEPPSDMSRVYWLIPMKVSFTQLLVLVVFRYFAFLLFFLSFVTKKKKVC